MNFGTPAAIFASSFIIGLSGALMPGPLLAVAVRDSARSGFVAAPLLVLGHGLLEAGLVVLVLLGLAEWLKGDGAAIAISLLGGAVLLWMAVGMIRELRTLRAPGAGDAGETGTSPAKSRARTVMDGIVVSLSNPYWSIWWATIGLAYLVTSRRLGAAGVAAFYAGHILSDVAWYLFVGFAVAAGRDRLSDRVYRGLVGCCAVFLAFFSLSFGYFGLTKLFGLN